MLAATHKRFCWLGAVSLSADVLHVVEKLLFLKSYFSRKKPPVSKSHCSRKATCIEKPCWVFCDFLTALGRAAFSTTRTSLEKLFSKKALPVAYSGNAACLENKLSKVAFLASLGRTASLESHFCRKATFCEKCAFFRDVRGSVPEKPLFSKSHFLRTVTFLATLARAASAQSHFLREATFLGDFPASLEDTPRDSLV